MKINRIREYETIFGEIYFDEKGKVDKVATILNYLARKCPIFILIFPIGLFLLGVFIESVIV